MLKISLSKSFLICPSDLYFYDKNEKNLGDTSFLFRGIIQLDVIKFHFTNLNKKSSTTVNNF